MSKQKEIELAWAERNKQLEFLEDAKDRVINNTHQTSAAEHLFLRAKAHLAEHPPHDSSPHFFLRNGEQLKKQLGRAYNVQPSIRLVGEKMGVSLRTAQRFLKQKKMVPSSVFVRFWLGLEKREELGAPMQYVETLFVPEVAAYCAREGLDTGV